MHIDAGGHNTSSFLDVKNLSKEIGATLATRDGNALNVSQDHSVGNTSAGKAKLRTG